MQEHELKVTLASRVAPDLKERLIAEAKANDLTPSAHIESIIQEHLNNQDETLIEPEFSYEEPILQELTDIEEESEEEVVEEEEIIENSPESDEELHQQISDLIEERDQLSEQIRTLEAIWPQLNEDEVEELNLFLAKLKQHNPDQPANNLILGSLYAACRNEESFFTYIAAGYWKTTREKRLRFFNVKTQRA